MIACLYDVHGNLPALEAVLADAHAAGAGRHVLGGDYALFGGWPAETVARLRELAGAEWIRGNGERWTADPEAVGGGEPAASAIAACAAALGPETVAALAALPERATVGDTLVVHGSPASDVASFGPEPAGGDAELLAGEAPPRLLFGHTHVAFRRRHGGTELVNPGSVGMPFDGDRRAAYALLHDDGTVEHRRVAYDVAAAVARVREQDGAWTATVAGRLERSAP